MLAFTVADHTGLSPLAKSPVAYAYYTSLRPYFSFFFTASIDDEIETSLITSFNLEFAFERNAIGNKIKRRLKWD